MGFGMMGGMKGSSYVSSGKGRHTKRPIERGQARMPIRPIENPFPAKSEFRLGLYHIIAEKDDYLICRGYDPNAKELVAIHTPAAFKTIRVAKPSLLQRTPWDGETVELIVAGGTVEVTFEYDENAVGKRTAKATVEGEAVEEIQRITMDYFKGDTITAVEVRENHAVDGSDTDTESGVRLTWVDLNFSGRCWAVSDEEEEEEEEEE